MLFAIMDAWLTDTERSASAEVKSNQSVSVSTMEEWEKELMEDPKVKDGVPWFNVPAADPVRIASRSTP